MTLRTMDLRAVPRSVATALIAVHKAMSMAPSMAVMSTIVVSLMTSIRPRRRRCHDKDSRNGENAQTSVDIHFPPSVLLRPRASSKLLRGIAPAPRDAVAVREMTVGRVPCGGPD